MEYIIFCICSIILARYLEKTSRVVSVAHDILFIVLSAAFFFVTDNAYISSLAIRVVGSDYYTTIHEALIDSQKYVNLGFSTLFIIESVIILITSVAAVIVFIKSLKEVVKSIKVPTIKDLDLSSLKNEEDNLPNKIVKINNQNKYLLKCCFLN